tara:strand:- start:361 stop:1302 length:942 start_codon:yes stop_codon:yes gene_type:complete
MGFIQDAVSKLTFKVQAANVIDANTSFQWYESRLENSPKITPDRILSQYSTVSSNAPSSVANLITLTASGGTLDGIVSNDYESSGTPVYHRLTQATNGNDTTYVAYTDPADRDSDRKWNWINPSSVPVNGVPVPYYTIRIYYKVGSTYTQLQATDAATIGGEVGWVWNYDQGLLLLSTDAINFLKGKNSGSFPELYVRGWRYIGSTGGGTSGSLIVKNEGKTGVADVSKIQFNSSFNVTSSATGEANISIVTYEHTQSSTASTWTITHNLDKYPSVEVFDDKDERTFGDVIYSSSNQIQITFSSAVAGYAYLN